jgi:phage terminase small subunit
MARSSESEAIRVVTREARRAWEQVAPGLRRRGILTARTALGLALLCQQFAQYRLLLEARARWPKDREIHVALEQARVRTRESAADFALLRPGRQQLTALTTTGEDRELLRIFGRPAA